MSASKPSAALYTEAIAGLVELSRRWNEARAVARADKQDIVDLTAKCTKLEAERDAARSQSLPLCHPESVYAKGLQREHGLDPKSIAPISDVVRKLDEYKATIAKLEAEREAAKAAKGPGLFNEIDQNTRHAKNLRDLGVNTTGSSAEVILSCLERLEAVTTQWRESNALGVFHPNSTYGRTLREFGIDPKSRFLLDDVVHKLKVYRAKHGPLLPGKAGGGLEIKVGLDTSQLEKNLLEFKTFMRTLDPTPSAPKVAPFAPKVAGSPKPFKVGDLVSLKSGGPVCTIQSIEKEDAWCAHFDDKGFVGFLSPLASLKHREQ